MYKQLKHILEYIENNPKTSTTYNLLDLLDSYNDIINGTVNDTVYVDNSKIYNINVINKWMITGRYNQIKASIRSKISKLTKSGNFYIGITHDCIKRSKATAHLNKNLENIIVLWKTSSLQKVRQSEKDMLDIYYNYKRCINKASGGGGNLPNNKSYYYLYVLTNRKN